LCLNKAIRSALAAAGWKPDCVVVAFPLARFPSDIPGSRVLYVTDDWLSGAALMGFSRRATQRVMTYNVAHSSVVAAVSQSLLEDLRAMLPAERTRALDHRQLFAVLPNGCPAPAVWPPRSRNNVAGLVGQLNERLDMDLLEAVQQAGINLRIIGPRTDRDPAFKRRLDALLQKENVEWTGPLPNREIPDELSRLGAGLTPYGDSAFNRASFPLKTLEYLAAGVPVVAADSPAVRWLATNHVAVASTRQDFVDKVLNSLHNRNDAAAEMGRRSYAQAHTWEARAKEFLSLVESSAVSTLPS
jgi:teichuronic acid biosynthesis glycosyltransferase TuaH